MITPKCHQQLRKLSVALDWDCLYTWKPPLRCLPRRLARHASRVCLGVNSGCKALNCGQVSASVPDTEHPSSSTGGCLETRLGDGAKEDLVVCFGASGLDEYISGTIRMGLNFMNIVDGIGKVDAD